VNAGEQLAVVGSTQDLVAMLRIPQSQISDINLGQSTIVNTHQHQIPGVVSRIDPTVVEGTVTVEVALTPPLPESARPDLNVDGRIITQTLKNAHYIKRPVNAKDFSALAMFKMNDSSNATRTQVEFGKGTDRFIQIINGATKSESFIISDMSEFSDAEHLSVTD